MRFFLLLVLIGMLLIACDPSRPSKACRITALEALNYTCTDPNPAYDLQLKITYTNPPANDSLAVTIGSTPYSFAVGTSPQVVNIFGLPPTGMDVDVFVRFSSSIACQLTVKKLYKAPDC